MKKLVVLPLIILLLPTHISESRVPLFARFAPPPVVEQAPALQALSSYKQNLLTRGQSLDNQGVLIETIDGGQILAEHNADVTFNPASVMKLATSLVALVKLGPDYRYRTDVLADGQIDEATRKLEGDLVIAGKADPMFSATDAQEVAIQISRLGISRVTGALRIAGPFYYFATGYSSNLSPETSAIKLRGQLERAGIKIDGQTVFGEATGTLLLSHYSDELLRILLYQNAHSSNAIAEVVGVSVGGPQAVQDFLIKELALANGQIYVGRTSGLDVNRITPRGSLAVLRALIGVLKEHSLKPEDVMAVAGIDSGTMKARLARDDLRGSVIAKTGTLVSIDNGVSTLVGIAYTKAHGPLLFAVFNSSGNVHAYRRWQDEFIESVISEEGGASPVSRSEDALAETDHRSIIQVLYKNNGQQPEHGPTD